MSVVGSNPINEILKIRRTTWEELELERMDRRGMHPKSDVWKAKYKEPRSADIDGVGALPEYWYWASVAQVGFVISGQTPKGVADVEGEAGIPWFKVGDMNTEGNELFIHKAKTYLTVGQLNSLKLHLQPEGTVIFPKRGGAIATNKKRVLFQPSSYDLNTMGVFPVGVEKKYFWYWFQTVDLGAIADGAIVPQINHGDIEPLLIPVAPPEQQKRIVAKIEELFSHIDAGIASLVKAKQLLKQYRQSVLKAAVTGELTKQWREDNKDKLEPASQLLERILQERRQKWEAQQLEQFKAKGKVPKDDRWKGKYKLEEPNPHMEFESPKEWAVSTIESITDPVRVICYGILMPKENVENGVLYVKVKDVKFGRVLVDQLNRTVPEIAAKYARASLAEGDLLLTIRGTYGRTAIAPKELNGGNITQDTVRISAIEPILNEYLIIFVDSVVAQQYFKVVARGVAVKGVNVQDVRNMNVPIPSVEEQKEIIKLVDQKITTIAHVEKALEEQLLKAGKNKQSILASAFSGRL